MDSTRLPWREITGDHAALAQVYRLRPLAWRTQVQLTVNEKEWKDAADEAARHWGCFDGPQLIAAFRISQHNSIAEMPHPEVYEGLFSGALPMPVAYYARAVVHPDHRRLGLFAESLTIGIQAARQMDAAWLAAVTGSVDGNRFAAASFGKAGYVFIGEGRPYRSTPYVAEHPPQVFVYGLGAAVVLGHPARTTPEVA